MLDGVLVAGDNNVLDGVDTTVGQLDHLIQNNEGSLQLQAWAKLVTSSIEQFSSSFTNNTIPKYINRLLSVPREIYVPGEKPTRPKSRRL